MSNPLIIDQSLSDVSRPSQIKTSSPLVYYDQIIFKAGCDYFKPINVFITSTIWKQPFTIVFDTACTLQQFGNAAFYNCTGLYGTLTLPNTLTYINYSSFYGCANLTSVFISNSVQHIEAQVFYLCRSLNSITFETNSTLQYIDAYAFAFCPITTIALPESLLELGISTFANCSLSGTINIPGSLTILQEQSFAGQSNITEFTFTSTNTLQTIQNYVFNGCTSLNTIVLPTSLTIIGESAFQNCSNLTIITIPDNVNNINVSAFQNCSRLNTVNISNLSALNTIGNQAFYNCTLLQNITLPPNLINLLTYVFKNCTNLTNINIPQYISYLADGLFMGCANLNTFTLPTTLIYIGNYSFQGCISLQNFTLPTTLTYIGNYSFQGCTSITNITLPSPLTNIGDYTFQNCTGLTGYFTIPSSIISMGPNVFQGCTSLSGFHVYVTGGVGPSPYYILNNNYPNYSITSCSSPFNTSITNFLLNVTTISNSAFQNSGITGITLPSSVSNIGIYAFAYCYQLATLIFDPPIGLTINANAFQDCSGLINVTIPITVTSIGDFAFQRCTSLQSVVIANPNVTLGLDIFLNDDALTLINFCGPYTPGITFPTGVTVYCAPVPYPCFKDGTKILCLTKDLEEKWMLVQHIRPGTLVKTVRHQYVPVNMIGTTTMYNSGDNERIKGRLYRCSKAQYPKLTEDLIMTGCHSILVDELTDKQRDQTIEAAGKILVTDYRYRLMTYLDEKAKPYEVEGTFNIWHLALDNNDIYMNYGIYANGLLVETCSQRTLKMISGMKLVL